MHLRLPNLVLTTLLAFGVAPVAAGPDGANVVGGAATIQGQGGPSVIINQSTPSAIINWRTFNIGTGENVRFNQPSSSSVALNRVTGGLGPSEILGTLTANGRVFIINRDGVLFGAGAVVNTAGFLATTSDIKNSDFMAGRYNFNIPGRPDASIVNQGRITATSGGFAALVAPGVRNTGTITATLGTVALASGNSFTLDMYGDKLITLAVGDSIASKVIDVSTGKPLKSLVSNEGKIRANGGRVELTAAAARTVVDSVINTSGVIKANSIGHRNGMIVLSAATGASKPAGAPAQTIKISGTLQAAGKRPGTKGGTVVVSGEDIKLSAARIDASGRAGGGKVLIGGDWGGGNPNTSLVKNQSAALEPYVIPTATTVSVDGATTINASAKERGNGGKVVLWSDSQTTFAGTILARGGSQGGDGGFVETSSHGQLSFTGHVDASAPKGAAGALLLDPADLFIVPDCASDGCGPSTIGAATISGLLAKENVVIATNNSANGQPFGDGDIFVLGSITWASNNSLTLSAYRDINIFNVFELFPPVTIANTGGGSLVLGADSTGTGTGTVNFRSPGFEDIVQPGKVDFSRSTGTVAIYYNPIAGESGSKYQNPTTFSCSGSCSDGGVLVPQQSQLTAYMLVNNASDLNLVRTNTSQTGTYALAALRETPLDAGSISNFAPIPNFNGVFDGQGQTIANLTIAPNSATTNNIGLFGAIGTSGIVRNLNLTNVNVSANPSVAGPQSVAALAGGNAGTIIDVSVVATNSQPSGTISGLRSVGMAAGGLVGQNSGLIQNSSSAATVSVGNANSAAFNTAGGLVGTNLGTITGSSASGSVSGGSFSLVGGLVGQSVAGSISSSSSTGAVATSGISSIAGGLVGQNAGLIQNSNSAATVSVVGSSSAAALNIAGGLVGTNLGTITGSSASGSISGGAFSLVGGLVGQNGNTSLAGSISSSSFTGTVTASGASSTAGGLVGQNAGLIQDSRSAATVSIGNPSSTVAFNIAGGLVGTNLGSITGSSASGSVSGGAFSLVGGLVGQSVAGSISSSSSTGAVTASGLSSIAGGLVGQNTGLIENSSSAAMVNVGDSSSTAFNIAGGLVGANLGFITGSSASGSVTGGSFSLVGGLVGQSVAGSISSSSSTGAVTTSGISSIAGGMVGQNTGLIENSNSAATVSVGGSSSAAALNIAGGLVGTNLGTITGSSASGSISGGAFSLVGGLVGENSGGITGQSYAQGNVSVGSNGTGGGLVGSNTGSIANALATGNVTGAAGTGGDGGITTLGGLVGSNQGQIGASQASGNVGVANVANLQAGGLVGSNSGAIVSSAALGSVQTGDGSTAGGLVGAGDGTISLSSATGAVTGGGNSVLGGFIGALSFANGLGFVTDSRASGPVTSTGPNSVVGGFVGLNGGTISASSASGPVTGTSSSYLGGFVGTNLGLIEQSIASGSVTGTGSNNIVGGFVGANFGSIDSSASSRNATSGTDSAVGAFAGSNAQFVNFQPGSIPGSSFPVGTITNSSASGTASGGTSSTVSSFIALNDPNTSSNPPAFPSIIGGCTDPTCVFVSTGQLPPPSSTPPIPPPPIPAPEPQPSTPQALLSFSPALAQQLAAQQAQQILNLTSTIQLAALNTAPVVNTTQGGILLPPQQAPGTTPGTGTGAGTGPGAGNQFLPSGFDRRIVDIPPPTETRLKTDEVMVQIRTDIGIERLRDAVAPLGVSILASEDLSILGSTAVRLHIDNGRSPAEVIEALAAVQFLAAIQPQYVYGLDQVAPGPAPAARSDAPPGDAAQYILQKLSLADVHRMVRGTNVPIAVIDSEIDATHPDLEGAVAQRYDAVGTPDKPHPHGTGMAGAIGAHQRLLGTAPAARLLAVHAFSTGAATPESTTFNILKGINWAVNQGVRVINMSFAGPKDPSLERALKAAYDRNITLIAAAGNAGPRSPPLYPGADPNVIAVTATDVDDKVFAGANRGKYISVSAPGVDILVPAPENAYQLTTGTSVAAAEVSGMVALLLERNPKLTPADIRRILQASAKRLGPGERDDNFGFGLIDPLKALQLADPRTATTAPATPTRQR
jgi:filamentous hemagglutinin family protein